MLVGNSHEETALIIDVTNTPHTLQFQIVEGDKQSTLEVDTSEEKIQERAKRWQN